jgi:hypothetical protein
VPQLACALWGKLPSLAQYIKVFVPREIAASKAKCLSFADEELPWKI